MAGYSGTPLIKKLGMKPGQRTVLIHAPEGYESLLGDLPDGLDLERFPDASRISQVCDFIHFFTTEHDQLDGEFPALKSLLAQQGMLWISWPKGKSSIQTNLNENVVRDIGLK